MKIKQDPLVIHKRKFESRLLHCFGSHSDEIDRKTAVSFIKHSQTDFLTLYTQGDLEIIRSISDFPIGYSGLQYKDVRDALSDKSYTVLVNTNHALTVEEAVGRAEVGYKYSRSRWIKLEVLNRKLTRPINREVIKAARILLSKDFVVLPLVNADIADVRKLEKMGCSAVRVLMSNIGSELGLMNRKLFGRICRTVKIPIIAEGGLRAPEDAYNAMVEGAAAVLVNRSLFCYKDPVLFIEALKSAIESGRLTFLCNQERKS